MADTKTHGAGERQTIDLSTINPLIDHSRDSMAVQAVLGFLSFMMIEVNSGGISLSSSDSLGMAFVLDTCRLALENMSPVGGEVRHG